MLLSLANDGLSTWSGEVLAVGLFKDQPTTELDSRWPGLANTCLLYTSPSPRDR